MNCSRENAEALTGELLERGSPPLTSEVLQMLNLWKFKSNPYRNIAMPYGWNYVYRYSFGMYVSRIQKFSVSTNYRNSNSIDKAIIKWRWAKYPNEMFNHTFSSITVNSDFSAKIHRGRNNVGLPPNHRKWKLYRRQSSVLGR